MEKEELKTTGYHSFIQGIYNTFITMFENDLDQDTLARIINSTKEFKDPIYFLNKFEQKIFILESMQLSHVHEVMIRIRGIVSFPKDQDFIFQDKNPTLLYTPEDRQAKHGRIINIRTLFTQYDHLISTNDDSTKTNTLSYCEPEGTMLNGRAVNANG